MTNQEKYNYIKKHENVAYCVANFLNKNLSYEEIGAGINIAGSTVKSYLKDKEAYQTIWGVKGNKYFKMVQDKIERLNPKKEKEEVKKISMDEQIVLEAKYYLEHNCTVAEAAANFDKGKSTLQKHFHKLAEIDPELLELVRKKQEMNQTVGRIVGDANGKRKPTYSKEEANKIADILISQEYTLDELSRAKSMTRTKLYELLTSDYIDEDKKAKIEAVFQANRHHTTVNSLMDEKERRNR